MHGLNLWFLAGSGFFITWDLDWNFDGFLAFFFFFGGGGGRGRGYITSCFLARFILGSQAANYSSKSDQEKGSERGCCCYQPKIIPVQTKDVMIESFQITFTANGKHQIVQFDSLSN